MRTYSAERLTKSFMSAWRDGSKVAAVCEDAGARKTVFADGHTLYQFADGSAITVDGSEWHKQLPTDW